MDKIVESVHTIIDSIVTEFPGEFPNGSNFVNELESELKYFVDDGDIDEWSLSPMSSDGWKLVLYKDGKESVVLRNDDGGKS